MPFPELKPFGNARRDDCLPRAVSLRLGAYITLKRLRASYFCGSSSSAISRRYLASSTRRSEAKSTFGKHFFMIQNRHVPRDFATICLKCLERDPNRRYGGAGVVAAELRRFLAGEPIQARPLRKFGRGARMRF